MFKNLIYIFMKMYSEFKLDKELRSNELLYVLMS
jgi:hypothetical protein